MNESAPLGGQGTFNLSARTIKSLDELVEEFGENKTQQINRAVAVLRRLTQADAVYVRETPGGELVRLEFW